MAGKHTGELPTDFLHYGSNPSVGDVVNILTGRAAGLSATVTNFDGSEWACYSVQTIDGKVFNLTPYELEPFVPLKGRHRAD